MTRRDEITHYVLRMVDSGLATRTPTGRRCNPWRVNLDDQPAPHLARWALTTITAHGWARWWDVGGIELAVLTTDGLAQLHLWDAELLGAPRPRSSRPLAGYSIEQLDRLARRLIGEAFPQPGKDRQA